MLAGSKNLGAVTDQVMRVKPADLADGRIDPLDTPHMIGNQDAVSRGLHGRRLDAQLAFDFLALGNLSHQIGIGSCQFLRPFLDAQFQFEFLPADADCLRGDLGQFNYWGKTLDLGSTGAMFRSNQVTDVTLDININSNGEHLGSDCAGCRDIESTISLRVGTSETTGGTPRTFAVDSPQMFVVKPDPNVAGKWVVFRQFDRPRG
jgi:hypothetical protein